MSTKLLVWLALTLAMATFADHARAVDVDTRIGFGQGIEGRLRYRPDGWTPLAVYLTGTGTSGMGQLQVSVRVGNHNTLYARRVTLHEGAMNAVETFAIQLRNNDPYTRSGLAIPEIEVQLLVDGRKVAGRKVALPTPLSPASFNVLALTRDGSGLNLLVRKQMGLFHRGTRASDYANVGRGQANNGIDPNADLTVLYPDVRALPASAQAYDMVDAIVLGDMPLDSLTDDQMDGLRGWVRDGGLLIVSGGSDVSRLNQPFVRDLLPVAVTGSQSLKGGELAETALLEQRYDGGSNALRQLPLASGTLKPEGRVLFGQASPGNTGFGLVSARPYGCGTVVFTAFDVLDPNARAWTGAPAFWRDVLRVGNNAISPRDVFAARAGDIYQNGVLRLNDALAGRQATDSPPWYLIAGFLGTYLILLVPVSYFVLKRLDRREWSWITAPVIVLGFTVASYLLALTIKGGLLTLNRAVVIETQANTPLASAYGLMTLYSPRRTTYDIALTGSSVSGASFRSTVPDETLETPANMTPASLTVEAEPEGATLRDTLVKLWDKRSFGVQFPVDMGGAIEAHTDTSDGHHLHVVVTNHTRYTFKNCVFIASGQSTPIGDLPPGATKEKTILHQPGNAVDVPVPAPDGVGSITPGSQLTQEQTRTRIAAAVAESLNARGYQNGNDSQARVEGRSATAFAGWFYDPLLSAKIDSKSPEGEEANLLVAHLPLPANAPISTAKGGNPFRETPHVGPDIGPGGLFGGRRMGGVFR